jgi:putative ABC transport system permease protein
MRTLSALGVRNFRHGFARLSLTAIGITLGVAVLFAVLVTNASTNRAIDRLYGGGGDQRGVAVESVGAYGGDVPADVLAKAAALDGVDGAWGGVWFNVPLPGRDRNGEQRQAGVNGFVEARKPKVAERGAGGITNKGRPPAPGADEIALPDALSRELHAGLHETVVLRTPSGPATLTVTRIMSRKDGKPNDARAFVTSVETARRLAGKGEVFTYAYLTLVRGVDPGVWTAAHADALGPDVRLRANADPGENEFRRLTDAIQGGFAATAAIALFVGAFLIFLTLSMTVIERTRTYGTLRALGASRRQVRRLVVSEGLVLAVIASLAGLPLGFLASVALIRLSAGLYGIPQPRIVVTPAAALVSFGLGVLVTMIATLVPARRAAKLTPVAAIAGSYLEGTRIGRAWILGAAMFGTGLAISLFPRSAAFQAGGILILFGAVLLMPLVTRPVSRVVGGVTRRAARGVGDVGVMHLAKERSRSAYTLSLVMVVLAMVSLLATVKESYTRAMERAFRRNAGAALSVWAPQGVTAATRTTIATTPGIAELTPMAWGETNLADGTRVGLFVIEPRTFFGMQGFPWVHGNDDEAERALERGGSVLVPHSLVVRKGLRPGGTVILGTKTGRRTFRIAGTFTTIEPLARVVIGAADGARFFDFGEPRGFGVRLSRGAHAQQVAATLKQRVGSGLFVNVARENQNRLRGLLRRYFRLFTALVLVSAVVGLLGLANTLAMSVLLRTREIGVLRAIGTHRRQLAAMILVESSTLCCVALVVALPLGWLLSVMLLRTWGTALGIAVPFAYPPTLVPLVALVALAIRGAAALAPARRAGRVDPVVALRTD